MKKMLLFFLGIALFASPAPVSAEVSVVATVNIQDAAIEPSEPGIFSARFMLSNRVGVQDNVRYRLEIKDKDGTLVDSVSKPEWKVTLDSKHPVIPVVSYEIPSFLPVGTYDVWAFSENLSGLILGTAKLGSFDVSSSEEAGVFFDASRCVLRMGEKESPLSEIPTVSPANKMVLSCPTKNLSEKNHSAVVWQRIRKESSLGVLNESVSDTERVFKGTEEKTIDIEIPVRPESGSYAVDLALLDTNDRARLSNTVSFKYESGDSFARIQNVVLNDAAFVSGSQASLDVLVDLREGIPEGKARLSAELLSEGRSCSDPVEREVRPEELFVAMQLPVIAHCSHPSAKMVLSDISGNILDSGTYGVDPSWPVQERKSELIPESLSKLFPYFVIGTLFFLAIAVIVFAIVHRKRNRISFPVFFAATLGLSLLSGVQEASADTLYLSGHDAPGGLSGTINVSVSGNTVTVSGSATTGLADNEDERFFLDVSGSFGSRRLVDTYTTSGGYYGQCSHPRFASSPSSPIGVCYGDTIYCPGSCSCGEDCNIYANGSCSNVSCSNGGSLQVCVNRPGSSSSRPRDTHTFSTSFTTASSGSVNYHAAFDAPYDCVADGSIHLGGRAQTSGSIPYTIVPPSPRPTATVSVTPTNVSYGGSVNVSFSSSNAAACYIRNSSDGLGYQNPGVFSYTWYGIPLTQTTTWSVYCTGPGGTSDTVSATATVCPAATPNWNGSACVGNVVPPSYSCTGSLPSGAILHSGDSFGLSSNVAYNYSSWNSSYKCEFYCDAGLSWNGSSCASYVPNPQVSLSGTTDVAAPGQRAMLYWNTADVSLCTASASPADSRWTGDIDYRGGSTDVYPASTTAYSLMCNGPWGQATDTHAVTVNAPSLAVCPVEPTINVGGTQTMTSRYKSTGLAVSCSNTTGSSIVTGSTTWNSSNPSVATVNSSGVVTGVSAGTSTITGTYSGMSSSTTTTVISPCISNCSSEQGNHCQGESFTTKNSCGATESCAGTRYCDFNWKEVTPQ